MPPEDASAIADAIATLATDRERLKAMSEASRNRAEQLFSSQKNTALTESVYAELLAVS